MKVLSAFDSTMPLFNSGMLAHLRHLFFRLVRIHEMLLHSFKHQGAGYPSKPIRNRYHLRQSASLSPFGIA